MNGVCLRLAVAFAACIYPLRDAHAQPEPPTVAPDQTADAPEACDGVRHLVFVDRSDRMKLKQEALTTSHGAYVTAHGRKGDCELVDDFTWRQNEASCECLVPSASEWDVRHLTPPDSAPRDVCADVREWWIGRVRPLVRDDGPPPVMVLVYASATAATGGSCKLLADVIEEDVREHVVSLTWLDVLSEPPPDDLEKLGNTLPGRVRALRLSEISADTGWTNGWRLGRWRWEVSRFEGAALSPGAPLSRSLMAPVDAQGWRPLRLQADVQPVGTEHSGFAYDVRYDTDSDGTWWLPRERVSALTATLTAKVGVEALREPRPDLVEVAVTADIDGADEDDGRRQEQPPLQPLRLRTAPLAVGVTPLRSRDDPRRLEFSPAEAGVRLGVCRLQGPADAPDADAMLAKMRWKVSLDPTSPHHAEHASLDVVRKHLAPKMARADGGGVHHYRTVQPVKLTPGLPRLRLTSQLVEIAGWAALDTRCQRLLPVVSFPEEPDTAALGLWLVLLGVALAGLIGGGWYVRNRRTS